MTQLAEIRKFLGALAGAVAVAVSAGLLSGTAEKWTTGAVAVATAFVVYLLPNDDGSPLARL
jgi:hypothetical protein